MLHLSIIFQASPVIACEIAIFEESYLSFAAIQDIISHRLFFMMCDPDQRALSLFPPALHAFLSLQGTFLSPPLIVCITWQAVI